MPPASPKKNTAPIWLFTGPEIGERNAAIEEVRSAASKAAGNLDAHTLYASDARMGDIVSLLQNGSLFADARFVVVRNAELIKKKDDVEQLLAWISESTSVSDAFLVLVSDEIGVDKKIEVATPKEQKRVFWELFENRKEEWIVSFFRKAGYQVEGDAVASILELVENNTDALKVACSRLTLFFPAGHRVTEADVESILAHNREESAFTLFDSLAEGDLEGALGILSKLSLSKESSPVQTVAGLTYCFRRLADWHRLAESGETDDFSLKKAGFSSKRAIDQYRKAARRWGAASASRILALLAKTDIELRSSGTALADCLLELSAYSILRKDGKPIAVAEYR
jgi:DNA polymerase-3 subunit delta